MKRLIVGSLAACALVVFVGVPAAGADVIFHHVPGSLQPAGNLRSVPEPTELLLFGSSLIVVARQLRRRES